MKVGIGDLRRRDLIYSLMRLREEAADIGAFRCGCWGFKKSEIIRIYKIGIN
jgi:hypothetical protein